MNVVIYWKVFRCKLENTKYDYQNEPQKISIAIFETFKILFEKSPKFSGLHLLWKWLIKFCLKWASYIQIQPKSIKNSTNLFSIARFSWIVSCHQEKFEQDFKIAAHDMLLRKLNFVAKVKRKRWNEHILSPFVAKNCLFLQHSILMTKNERLN